jgi:hypothetical protein
LDRKRPSIYAANCAAAGVSTNAVYQGQERIAPDKLAQAREHSRMRGSICLPKHIKEARKRGADLLKAAKGLR